MSQEIVARRGSEIQDDDYDQTGVPVVVGRTAHNGELTPGIGVANGVGRVNVSLTEKGQQLNWSKIEVITPIRLPYYRHQNAYVYRWESFDSFVVIEGIRLNVFFITPNTVAAPNLVFDTQPVYPIGYWNGVLLRATELRTDFMYELTLLNGVYRITNCGAMQGPLGPILHPVLP